MPHAPGNTPIDTGRITGRRLLRFDSIDQVLVDVDRIIEADREGNLKPIGNWTLGQTLNHLAAWAEYSYTGAPMKVPFFIRWILRTRKQAFLYKPMRAGVKIPRIPGGTLAIEAVPLTEVLPRFRQAFERLKREAPTAPNVIFGPLTQEEWIAINLRHAELHQSFLKCSS